MHAVSVGEVLAARPVLAELRKRYPHLRLFLSTTTLSGQQLARQSVPDVDGIFYFPFDWTFTVRRTLRVVRPRLFVMVETEIWPNLLRECRKRGIATMVINGRISPRSFARYRLVAPWFRRVLADVIALLRAGRRGRAADAGAGRRPGEDRRHRQPEVRRAAERAGPQARARARAALLPRRAQPPGADGGQHAARRRGAGDPRLQPPARDARRAGRAAHHRGPPPRALRRGGAAVPARRAGHRAAHRAADRRRAARRRRGPRHHRRAGAALSDRHGRLRRRQPGAGRRSQHPGAGRARQGDRVRPLHAQLPGDCRDVPGQRRGDQGAERARARGHAARA